MIRGGPPARAGFRGAILVIRVAVYNAISERCDRWYNA